MPEAVKGREESGGIALFRIAGIRIFIDYSWFIIFALIFWSLSAGYFPRVFPGQSTQTYWISGFLAALFFFISIIVHELAHSLVAIRSGIKIPEIRLFIFGGVSRLSEEARTPGEELKIALAGPLSSFVLAFIFWVMGRLVSGAPATMLPAIFGYLTWINIALGIFNLIPGFPLDGGRVLRAVWWWRTGSLTQSTKVASEIGKWFALALIFLGALQIFTGGLVGGLWLIFIGMFLRGMAEGGYQELIVRQALKGVLVREVMVDDVVTVSPDLSRDALANEYFLRFGYRGFPVMENGRVIGLVPLESLGGVAEDARADTRVRQMMLPIGPDIEIGPEESLADALMKMTRNGVNHLVVTRGGDMAGLITKTGLKRFIEIKHILDR